MTWVERVAGEIWTTDGFIDDDLVQGVLSEMRNSTNKNLFTTDKMSAKLKSVDINYNSYDYIIYQYDIRKNDRVVNAIADRLDELLSAYGQTAPRENLNAMQCFVKSFGPNSHYDLHVESARKYGQWGFIHFLSDEDSGELVFPDEAMTERYLDAHPGQRPTWEGNVGVLSGFGEKTSFVGPFSVKPSYNQCIFFRTQSAHWVEPMLSTHDGLTRPTITGWPHASQQMLSDLDRNCNINENFGNH